MNGYQRHPSPMKTTNPMWCISRLSNGSFSVRVWVPGEGYQYIGCYATVREAQRARDEARRRWGLILK